MSLLSSRSVAPSPTRLFGAAAIATMIAANPALAAPITYSVNEPIGSGDAVGTIQTDGTLGTLAKGNIVSWNLQVNGAGASTTLVSDGTSTVLLEGIDLTATPTELLFNFSGTDGGYFAFQANNPGVFSGNKYVCFNSTSNVCKPGASAVPASVFDATAQFQAMSGNQVIGVAQGGASTPLSALEASILALSRSRTGQMLLNQLESQLLLGLNEQVSCGNCGGVGMGFGSFNLSGHGRYALSKEWTVMGGVDLGQYQQRDANVNLNAGFAASLQWDPDVGPSRPYASAGVSAALQDTRYSRSYAMGSKTAVGVGKARNYDVAVYGELGWVDRITPIDEAALYLSYSRTWQIVGGYAEGSGPNNPLGAVVPGGTDVMESAGVHGQITHLFGRRIEAGINGGLNWAFNSTSGLDAKIAGGSFTVAQPQFITYEVGGRVGVRVKERLTLDLFVNGILAQRDIGSSVHGGFGARWDF
jgi:hypothetical protein